jgi:hypothetical protein
MLLGCRTSAFAFEWKTLNAEVVDQSENDTQKIAVLKDKQNHTFKVIYQDEAVLEKLSAPMIKYKNIFYTWKNINCKDLTFMVFANFLDVVIIPGQFMYNGQNIAPAIPAGITMTYNGDVDLLRYDFRIISGDQFIRINGNYVKEDELVNKTGLAYNDPKNYLQPAGSMDWEFAAPGEMNEKMVQSLIYLNNEDWNGRHKTIPLETIHKVVELKKANPESTKIQLWRLVKKEKINITKRQFELILILYFNELD